MKYAVFGGTFDPIHLGHTALATAVLEQLELDQVILVPNAQNPLKRKAGVTARQRLEMCQIATENHPGLVVSNIEISRGGMSYAVETLEELHMAQPGQAWLIIGTDALANFVHWRKPIKIAQLARLAVVERGSKSLATASAALPESIRDVIDVVKMTPSRASSTDIRDMIGRGEDPEMWLNQKVWEYILEHRLYKPKT